MRYLCKRLRGEFPELRIAVGFWDLAADETKLIDGLRAAGASHVAIIFSRGWPFWSRAPAAPNASEVCNACRPWTRRWQQRHWPM